MREFLHVDDMAQAVLFALDNNLDEHLYNVGSGSDLTIKALAEMIQNVIGHSGEILWDDTKPDGTPKKLLDSTMFNLIGWNHSIELIDGIIQTYQWFLENNLNSKDVFKKITQD